MCGIAGYVDFSSGVNPSVISFMIGEIVYRGPDSSGIFVSSDKKAGLGVRRLSIIDLVTGDQPIKNEDESLTVIYNGEIYNYRELVQELKRDGHEFKTESDTEVLLHLYEKYGYNMAKYLNGMFAFAIWDDKKKELFIARDRAGIKPLYFSRSGNKLVFGSEVKTILKVPGFNRKVDKDALSLYCYFGYIPSEKSMFEGIVKLLPGHSLTFSKRGLTIRKFFEINPSKPMSEKPLKELLRDAVVGQLHADVPVGVLLSGGLDSSLLSCFISEIKSLKSFSIGFKEQSFDESQYAKTVAKKLGTKHYSETFEVKEIPDLYKSLTKLLDEPLADASFFPTYKVSKLARKYVTVALSGDGGDELFGGYPTYQAQIIAEKLKYLPKFVLDSSIFLLNMLPESDKNYPPKELAKIVLKGVRKEPVDRHLYMMRTFFRGENILYKKPEFSWLSKVMPKLDSVNPVRQAQITDYYTYLRDDFLVKTDRASMYNSLEVRVPYLDNDVIDYAYSYPRNHVNLLETKILLRNLLKRKLPEVAKRPKKGFGIPVAKWIRGELKDFAYEAIRNPKLYDYIDRSKIEKIWNAHQERKENNAGSIWMLVMLSGWLTNWT
ncbi:asparagine synthase (glutamine-hydrolyzing) [Patescibacteria group bacterium]|nr:asparagine synthase (glutamine-hydrolyzing) [Patescibacteria group bacterium]